jgi:hypothetical protein
MGEIATWSAVKTKVGLGKDSNECPTKAELLALSPTGTGESYIGLEISNASSYGDNETIQLSDIHKVTYKYTLALTNKTLNFTALGGAPTPAGFDLVTQKQKYLDGVAQSGVIPVSYNLSAHPDWIYSENGLKATENLNTQERYGSVTFTQAESGKSIDGAVSQAAASQRFEYTFSSKYPGINFNALGGISSANRILDITSTRQEYRNNHTYGNLVQISFTNTGLPSWLINTNESWSAQENKSLSSRSHSMTYTQNESGKKFTVTFNQAAGTQTYGDITINPTSGIADIPAAGGTSGVFTYSYSQLWGWNGKTNDGGTITSGATVNWSNAISGSNLGTTPKARTRLGSRTLTLSQNGKSASKSVDVYQAANQIVNVTQGAWVVSISANPSTLTEQGGTSQISASARASRTNHWSSGATNAASDATGTPTLSIPTAVTGFSLSGTTLTVAENTTANQRSVVVRATMDTVYKEVTVTQSAYLVEWRYTLTTSTPTLNFDALGTTKSGTISSYREKYINGSLVEGSPEGVNIQVKSTSAEIQSATAAVAITLKENTTTQARTGTVVYEQVGSGKTVTITCSQAAATISTRYDLYWALSDRGNELIDHVTSYTLGPNGEADRIHLFLLCDKITTINGVDSSRTIVETGPSNLNSAGPVYTDSSTGEPTSIVLDDGGNNITPNLFPELKDRPNTYNVVIGSDSNDGEYQQTVIMTYIKSVMDGSVVVGKVPEFYWVIDPIPYTRIFEFSWKEGSIITNMTLAGDIYGSSADSRDIISYVSLRRNNVEFAKKYIKPTLIPPSEDWLQVIDNGQNSDNSYNWAFRALTNNEGDSARNLQVRFEQPGNGNQVLYAYVSQDPMATELNCELGNYYSSGASDIVNIGFGWNSRDGGDTTDSGGMNTPGGYLRARISLPAENDLIDMYAVGLPTYGKPLKIKVSNIRKVKKISYDNYKYTGLSVGYSQQDYKLGIVMSVGMESYFQLTPSILSEAGEYGGGIQIQVTLKQTYNGYSGDVIADITLTPKDSNLPTLYLKIAWGNP